MDAHDTAALRHYEALIALHYPPDLATALVAARYQVGLVAASAPLPLPALREIISATKDAQPRLRRVAGQLLEKIDMELGLGQGHSTSLLTKEAR